MGSGSINVDKWADRSKQLQVKQAQGEPLFEQKKLKDALNPLNKMRESLRSEEHPNPTSVIVCFDVTGSMGQIPKYFVTNTLTKVFERLSSGKITGLDDPQLMFMAVGDVRSDFAPLQVGQFESSNASADDLLNIWLEGHGGGNQGESYHLAWYYAANRCVLDSWKAGKKGILVTIGDENVHPHLDEDEIRKCIDSQYAGEQRVRNATLVKQTQEKWDVNHIVITETQGYKEQSRFGKTVQENWEDLLGKPHVIAVHDYREVANAIADRILPQAMPRLDMSTQQKIDRPVTGGRFFSKGSEIDAKAKAPANTVGMKP